MKRLFRGLRREPPAREYDAVVIGAGVGGLVCANLLARDGLSVLLVEQHYMAGGYCSTFRRGGYTFDAGSHFYPLLGNPQTITGSLLTELGVRTKWVTMDPIDTFHLPDGSRYEVPADLDAWRAQLAAAFPAEREALERFFEEVREAYLLGLLAYFRGRDTPALDRFRHLDLGAVLDRHFQDPKLKLLLTGDCAHWGSPPQRTSFVFDSMLRLSYFLGNYYPVGGSQAFADELARCLEQHGGHVLMSTAAERIVVEGGVARGVELRTLRGPLRGTYRVRSKVVISNADLRVTYDQLLAGEPRVAAARRQISTLRPSYPCYLVHIGLEGVSHEDLEAAQGYYWQSWDPNEVGGEGLRCKIFVPTLYEPRMAPPGGQIVILQKVLAVDYKDIPDWQAHKARVEERLLNHLRAVLPGIDHHIKVHLTASAQTSHRFTLNYQGAMLGWEMSPDQVGEKRPGIRGPVDGLFFVGHWVEPGGGITPVIVSAMRVADAVASRVS